MYDSNFSEYKSFTEAAGDARHAELFCLLSSCIKQQAWL